MISLFLNRCGHISPLHIQVEHKGVVLGRIACNVADSTGIEEDMLMVASAELILYAGELFRNSVP